MEESLQGPEPGRGGDKYRGVADPDGAEVIRIKPDDPEPYYNIGSSYYNLRQYQRAVADYTEAIRLKPEGQTYYGRSSAYKMIGDLRAAYRDLKKAKQLGFRDTTSGD